MKIVSAILVGVTCYACSLSETYTLMGTLPEESEVTEVYLLSKEGKGADTLARGSVQADRTFTLKGKAESSLLYLNMGNHGGRIYFYSEPGEYQLEKAGGSYFIEAQQEGILSRLNVHLRKIEENTRAQFDLQKQIARAKEEEAERLGRENERLWKEGNELLLAMVADFKGSDVAVALVQDNMWTVTYDFKLFSRVVETMGDVPDSEAKNEIMEKYEEAKRKQLTGKAPDFTLPDVNEKEVNLSNYKGKYLLIDFWASWCKPCRMKAKELKKHYPRLKELGIEVVSISCDKNKNQWLKAIEEDQPMWTQLLIDKKINGTDTADDYKVEFIPTLYLISPEGEILEKNPSMEEIETFVKKG